LAGVAFGVKEWRYYETIDDGKMETLKNEKTFIGT